MCASYVWLSSPLIAYVEIPNSATSAAATSSCVESGFEAQSTTSAPPAWSARARFPVSLVTWRQAESRMPSSGLSFSNRSRILARTGLERSAHSMRSRPLPARARSFTSWAGRVAVVMRSPSGRARDPGPRQPRTRPVGREGREGRGGKASAPKTGAESLARQAEVLRARQGGRRAEAVGLELHEDDAAARLHGSPEPRERVRRPDEMPEKVKREDRIERTVVERQLLRARAPHRYVRGACAPELLSR